MTFLSCGFIEENIGNDEQSNGGTDKRKRKLPNPTLTGYSDPLWAAEPITISDWFQTPLEPFNLIRYHYHPRRSTLTPIPTDCNAFHLTHLHARLVP